MYTTFRTALAGLLLACTVLLGGCFDGDNDSAPQFTQQPANVTVAEGARATFTVAIDGSLPLQWFRNGLPIAGATGATYTTPPVTAADDGANFYAATTSLPPVGSQSARLTVLPAAPTITTQPAPVTAVAGSAATFTVVATGASPTYQWQRGTTDIAGATAASYTIAAVAAGDSGATFRVIVTTRGGSVTSNAAALTVTTPVVAPAITTQPANAGVTVGTPATFSVVATGTSPTYQWQRGTTNIAGATNASYTTPATVIGDNGATFRVIVTNSAGSVTSSAATLTVTNPTPPPTVRTTPMIVGTDGSGLALKADGTVWGWGRNQHGELGQGDTNPSLVPVQVRTTTGTLERIVKIAASGTHVLAVDADGFVWAWGTAAALGTIGADGGTVGLLARRVQTDNDPSGGRPLPDVVDVAAGAGISIALDRQGRTTTWGSDARGAMGNNVIAATTVPYPRNAAVNDFIVEVAAGDNRGFARTADGKVYAWGDNTNGALSDLTVTTRPNPVQIATSGIVRVSAGATATHFILADGNARVAGRSHQVAGDATGFGQACFEQTYPAAAIIPKPVAGSQSSFASAAAVTQAGVYVFGDRLYEVGDILTDNVPNSCTRALVQFNGLQNVAGASGTWGRFSHVWTGDGRVYGVGDNSAGQLGIGSTTTASGARELVGFNLLGAPAASGSTVLSLDFESPLPASVSAGTAQRVGAQSFAGLGRSGNQFGGNLLRSETGNVVTVTLTNLPPHSSIDLEFLFAAIDSLDGVGSPPAGDYLKITMDGATLFREAFANATSSQIQSYLPPPGVELARRVDLGFTGPGSFYTDSAYDMGADPRFQRIPHTASTLTLTFQIEGAGIQDLNDESWGMDNLRISVNP